MADDDKPLKLTGAAADTTTEEADSAATTHEDHATTHEEPEGEEETLSSTSNTWGPLELRRTIGQGRFGTVHVAWDPSLEREVALKILRKANQSAAVIQEARLLARVRHPNVVTVYGVDRNENAVGLWMELVEGLTLKQVLSLHGVLGAQEAALIGLDLCRAVAAVHKAGLLHRDIKVQNVMREAGGRIVLMDFGAGEIRAEATSGSRRIGTPAYVAPEMFDGAPATIASDVYSLGVVLYPLVTKQYPVEGETISAVAAAHARGEMITVRSTARPAGEFRPGCRSRAPAGSGATVSQLRSDAAGPRRCARARNRHGSFDHPCDFRQTASWEAVDGRLAIRQSRARAGARVLLQWTR